MISNKIEISDQDRKCVMSIERDRIWVDPSVSVSEAAQAVIDALQEYIVGMVDVAVKEEREACAKVLDDLAAKDKLSNYYKVAALLIRERGAP